MRRQSAKKEARSGNVVSSMLSAEGNHAWCQVFKYVASKMQRCHIMSLFDGDSGDGGGGGRFILMKTILSMLLQSVLFQAKF